MTAAGNERVPGTNELARIVHGDRHEPIDLAAEQLAHLQATVQNEITANRIAELLSTRPDLRPETPTYGLNIKATGNPDATVAVFGPNGEIESYDF